MTTRKLTSTDAFVVVDLPDAPVAAGVARLAPKLLVDGATWLARSQTYQFAAFGRKVSGASAGVNSPADARAEALAAFVGRAHARCRRPARSCSSPVGASARPTSPSCAPPIRRPPEWWDQRGALRATGVAAAAAVGDRWLARRSHGRGRGLRRQRTRAGRGPQARGRRWWRSRPRRDRCRPGGSTPTPSAGLGRARRGHDRRARRRDRRRRGGAARAPPTCWCSAPRPACSTTTAAAGVQATVVVPSGPIPVTAKALAVLGRAGVVVLPDFVTTGGPPGRVAGRRRGPARPTSRRRPPHWSTAASPACSTTRRARCSGACEQAESFLATWCDELPFGRPIG